MPKGHRGSREGAFTIFWSLEAFFWCVSFKINTFLHFPMVEPFFDVKKSRVLQQIKIMFFKQKTTWIILYQQLSSLDETFRVGWPGMHPLENLFTKGPFTPCMYDVWGCGRPLQFRKLEHFTYLRKYNCLPQPHSANTCYLNDHLDYSLALLKVVQRTTLSGMSIPSSSLHFYMSTTYYECDQIRRFFKSSRWRIFLQK